MKDARKTRRDFLRPVPDPRESEPPREPVASYEPVPPKPIAHGDTAPHGTPTPYTSEGSARDVPCQPVSTDAPVNAPEPLALPAPFLPEPQEVVPVARTPSGQLLKPGECFAGKYRIVSVLGMGQLARVYRAKQLPAERDVALKVLLTRYADRPEMRRAMEREGTALSRVQHPGIVTIYDIGSDEQGVWVVSEFLEGETVRKRLKREGPFSLESAVLVTLQAAAAVAAAHDQGILHGDLKPENVFLTKDENVKVVDFLTARFLTIGEDDDVRDEFAYATAEYAAPECFDPSADPDERSDLYSLAIFFIELVTGSNVMLVGGRPAADALVQLRQRRFVPTLPPEIPLQMAPLLLRALEKKPGRRQANVRDFARDLQQAYRHVLEDAEEVRPTWIDRWGHWLRALWVGGPVGLAFGLVAFLFVELLGPRALPVPVAPTSPSASISVARSITTVAAPAPSTQAPTTPVSASAPAPAVIPVPSGPSSEEALFAPVPAAGASTPRPLTERTPHTTARAPTTDTAPPHLFFGTPSPEKQSVAKPAHPRPTKPPDVSSGL